MVCPGTDPSDAAGHAAAAEAPGRDAPRPSVRNGGSNGEATGMSSKKIYHLVIWLFNIAMGNGPFIDDVPNLKMLIFQFAM